MKKIFGCLTIITFEFMILTSNVYADGYVCDHGYHTFGDYHMSYGVGDYGKNRRYYYESGFDSTYSTYIANAVSEWVHTSSEGPGVKTSISIRKTTTKKSALFEFSNEYLGKGILGETKFYLYQDELSFDSYGALTKNYGWAQCLISVSELDSNNITAAQKQATIAHELGHAMGLSHQNTRPASIMCQTGYGRTATRADATDCNTINHIYG
jgi:hypothetical protein